MNIQRGDIVRSAAGRDAGKLFYVLGTEDEYAAIANGRERRVEKPKRKKLKHLHYVGTRADRVSDRLKNNERVSNSELRKALADFSSATGGVQGGM